MTRCREPRRGARADGPNLRAYYQTNYFGIEPRGARRRRHQPACRPQRDLRPCRRVELRQDQLDQDHRARDPPAAQRGRRLGHVQFRRPRSRHLRAEPERARGDPLAASVLHPAGLDERAEPGAAGAASFVDFALRHIGKPMPEFLRRWSSTSRPAAALEPACSTPIRTSCPAACGSGSRSRSPRVCRPDFIIADEPTTALDVVVQKDVLALIREVQHEIRSSMIFVTHDISVHANIADRLGIMYAGRLVEEGRPPM